MDIIPKFLALSVMKQPKLKEAFINLFHKKDDDHAVRVLQVTFGLLYDTEEGLTEEVRTEILADAGLDMSDANVEDVRLAVEFIYDTMYVDRGEIE